MKGLWKQENRVIIVEAEMLDVIIPSDYFVEPSIAEDYGTEVNSFAFVFIRGWNNGNVDNLFPLQLPSRLTFSYSEKFIEKSKDFNIINSEVETHNIEDDLSTEEKVDSEKNKDLFYTDSTIPDQANVEEPSVMDTSVISEDAEEEISEYYVFRAFKNDILVHNTYIVQSVDNMFELFKALNSAKLGNVSYEYLSSIYMTAAKLNKVNSGVTSAINELMISELVRWKKDLTVPLRLAMASGKATDKDGVLCKLKDLPNLNSNLSGIGFENIVNSTQIAVTRTYSGKKQRVSPIEDTIKY